ncbi:MAG: gamma carbonic anhydrase family protein [Betaproteobacteria bacterium]|nr:gamma carbonic anhydrase family protein [Betaproteobacteria bacterium]
MPIYKLGDRSPVFVSEEWFIAPTAAVIGTVTLGHQASIWFNVVVRSDREIITIGERCNVQDGSVLHADPGFPLRLGRNVTIGHKAMLHGCSIGDGSLIGMNSVLLNGASIGSGCIVGAHSLIPEGKVFPDGVLILGSPGKVVRDLKQEERDFLLGVAEGYVKRAQTYREGLQTMVLAAPQPRQP